MSLVPSLRIGRLASLDALVGRKGSVCFRGLPGHLSPPSEFLPTQRLLSFRQPSEITLWEHCLISALKYEF